jgi:hypothetical protein
VCVDGTQQSIDEVDRRLRDGFRRRLLRGGDPDLLQGRAVGLDRLLRDWGILGVTVVRSCRTASTTCAAYATGTARSIGRQNNGLAPTEIGVSTHVDH